MCRKTIAPGSWQQTTATVKVTELPAAHLRALSRGPHGALDPATRSLLVEIDIPNSDHALRPGTFAEVSLGLREIPQALVVPPQAVISTPPKSLLSSSKGKAKSITVQTGISDGHWMEITAGLWGDEEVVAVGSDACWMGHLCSPRLQPAGGQDVSTKFERRARGGTPPPPGNLFNGARRSKEIAHEIPIADQRVPHAGTHVVNGTRRTWSPSPQRRISR